MTTSTTVSRHINNHFDVYMRQFPPQGGAWHHRRRLKVTSCGRKCTTNKPEPGSAHDRRHIMTSPGYTGISRRDMPLLDDGYSSALNPVLERRLHMLPSGHSDHLTTMDLSILNHSSITSHEICLNYIRIYCEIHMNWCHIWSSYKLLKNFIWN